VEEVLEICVPVFGLSMLGYLATRIGWFSEQSAEGLARFVFDWAVPMLLFRLFSTQSLPTQFPWRLLLSFYVPVLVLYGLVMVATAVMFRLDAGNRIIAALGSAYGNAVLLGLPLMLLAFGDEGTVPYLVLVSVHMLLLYSISTILLELLRHQRSGAGRLSSSVAKGLSSNPILIGIAAGLLFNFSGFSLPGPVDRITQYMQHAVAACSLFALGASLTRYNIAGHLPETFLVVLAKNVVLPVFVWGVAHYVLMLNTMETIAAVMFAAQPTGIMVYLFAERYGIGQRLATTTIFISSIVSIITVTVVLALVR
jgi:hypothetical protein